MTWIWRRFEASSQTWRFFKLWDHYRSMRIWRLQQLDGERLLLRMITEQALLLTRSELHNQHCLYVIFDWKAGDVS